MFSEEKIFFVFWMKTRAGTLKKVKTFFYRNAQKSCFPTFSTIVGRQNLGKKIWQNLAIKHHSRLLTKTSFQNAKKTSFQNADKTSFQIAEKTSF